MVAHGDKAFTVNGSQRPRNPAFDGRIPTAAVRHVTA